MSRVTIDGVEYEKVRGDLSRAIVVLDRGFVVYGRVTFGDRDMVIIEDCCCIRRWGTGTGTGTGTGS